MTEPALFAPRTLMLWIAAATLSFGVALWLMFSTPGETTVGPSSYSNSAIGHAGIAELLTRLQIPVIKSKAGGARRPGLLVLAEPENHEPKEGGLAALLRAKRVLLVLPKWVGRADPAHDGWIDRAFPADADAVLRQALPGATLLPARTVETWSRNDLDVAPHFEDTVQLVKSDRLKPLVATDDGILLGELDEAGRKLWVLADPDVIANHGLAHGNADFAVALFQRLRNGGTIVFDESIHGFDAVPPSPMDLIFGKRFLATAIEALIALLLLLWATIGRFGTPETAPPPLGAGKQTLIRNVAQLMDYAGYQHVLVRRYVEATIRRAAVQTHRPRGLDGDAGLDWLQQLAQARGGTIDALALRRHAVELAAARRKDLTALFGVARAIRQWKQELTDGSRGGSPDRGRHSRRGAQGGGGPR